MIKHWMVACALIALFLTGCAVKVPTVSTYVLTVPNTAVSVQAPRTARVLLVSTMVADPGYRTSRMLYVTEAAHLRGYTRNAWVAPPAQMLMPLLVERIESKKYFRAVVSPPFAGNSDYRLDTRLIILQQEFMQPVSQVRCVVRAVLSNEKTGRVIADQRFQAIAPAPGNNPASGAAAANQAAQQVSEQIALFTVANIVRK